jgi:hypothetical protein
MHPHPLIGGPAPLLDELRMTFLLSGDGRDIDVLAVFRRYSEYVEARKAKFPPSAYALATSEWFYNFQDHRCPRDAWLEAVTISEPASGERHEHRSCSISVRLLGAYHDGHIELRYPQVFSYSLSALSATNGHCDWRYDEFRLSDDGHLIHEIEWWGSMPTATWVQISSSVGFPCPDSVEVRSPAISAKPSDTMRSI